MMKVKYLGPSLFVALLIAAPSSAQQIVRVGYSGTGVAKNLHKTIERAGLWKKRGLDVRLIYFTSGATMAQAMVSGDLELADSDVPAMLNAVSAGALDGKLISVYINRFPFAFVVRNDVKTPEDLKGKQIAISRFGSSSDVTTRMLLRQYNIDPEKDVRIIQATGTTRVPAMVAGQIHATLIGTYDVPVITDSGCCRVMVDMLELPIDYARFGQVVPTQLLRSKRELLTKFAEGLIEGIYVFKTNKELAISVLRAEGIKGPEYSYPRVAAAMRERPIPETKGVQAVMDSVRTTNSKITQAKDVMDGSVIEEIDRSGYIKKLYGK
ncbi:MAG TPA: ABC transporter substrate-binding protein [Candidatus Binatia bacterium]|nr:ABC transporter substrate-binding protein [Candidatus Binatia bacterium]